jgi:hypothetical protein
MKAAVTCVSLRLVLICSRDGRATVQSELFGSSRPKVQRACHQRALSPNLWPAPRRRKNRSTRLMTESSSRRTYTLYSGTSNLRLPPEMQEECHFGVIEKWPYLEATKAGARGLRHGRSLRMPTLWGDGLNSFRAGRSQSSGRDAKALRLCRPQIARRAVWLPRHWRTKIRDVAARVHLGRQQKRDSLAWSTSVVVVRGIAATRSYVSRSRLGGLCVRASLVEGRVEAVWLSSRRRFASSERRSSREIVCLKRRRSMTPPRAYGS